MGKHVSNNKERISSDSTLTKPMLAKFLKDRLSMVNELLKGTPEPRLRRALLRAKYAYEYELGQLDVPYKQVMTLNVTPGGTNQKGLPSTATPQQDLSLFCSQSHSTNMR